MNDLDMAPHGTGPRVLVMDEDPGMRLLLRRELTAAGYRAQDVEPREGALGLFAEHGFDLLILDIDSPAVGGRDSIRIVREFSAVPILALSVHGEEDAIAEALSLGADDYVQKPVRLKELLARATNALRRRAFDQGKAALVVSDGLEIDLLHRRVRLHGCVVRLPPNCYEVLRVLAENPGKVLTHREILCAVWGAGRADRIEYLRVAIRNLRQRLEADPVHPLHILTETRVGYRLDVRGPTRDHGLAIAERESP